MHVALSVLVFFTTDICRRSIGTTIKNSYAQSQME